MSCSVVVVVVVPFRVVSVVCDRISTISYIVCSSTGTRNGHKLS